MSSVDLRYPRQTLWADYIRAGTGAGLCGLPLAVIEVNRWIALILGAGFDCRALRLTELADIPVFEVDRAPMLALKEHVLGEASQMGRRVHRVGVDFQKDNLGQRLVDTVRRDNDGIHFRSRYLVSNGRPR